MMHTRSVASFAARVLGRWVRSVFTTVVTLVAVAWAVPARAQCDPLWMPGIGMPGTNGTVRALAFLPGGDMIVGGDFTSAGSVLASRIARYNPTTGVWSALGSGVDGPVRTLVVLPGGDVLAGGEFTSAGGVTGHNYIARYNPTNGSWSPLGAGVAHASSTARVLDMAVLPGGDVLVGGHFTAAGGIGANRIARYNPTTGAWSALGSGVAGTVSAFAVLPSGDVIVGGNFSSAGGVPANRVVRYNPNTGIWSALGLGIQESADIVLTLAVLPDGDVIAGGAFERAAGIIVNNIARVNPSTGVWSALGRGTNSPVQALAVLPSGHVIASGDFIAAGGITAFHIARYDPAIGVWSPLGLGITADPGYALAVVPGGSGDLIVGGSFTTAGGLAANRLARYGRPPEPSITSQPRSMVAAPSGTAMFGVWATAGFGSIGAPTFQWRKDGVAIDVVANPSAATPGLSLTNVQAADLGSYDCVVTNSCGGSGTLSNAATLTFIENPCPVDFNADGFVDFFDYADFVEAFESGC